MGPGMLLVYETEIAYRRERLLEEARRTRLLRDARAAARVRPAGLVRRLAAARSRLVGHSPA